MTWHDPLCPIDHPTHRCVRRDGRILTGPDQGDCWVAARAETLAGGQVATVRLTVDEPSYAAAMRTLKTAQLVLWENHPALSDQLVAAMVTLDRRSACRSDGQTVLPIDAA